MNAEGRAELQRIAATAPHQFTRVTARALLRDGQTPQDITDFFHAHGKDQ